MLFAVNIPEQEPQVGQAMCARVGAQQFGQLIVWEALAFQVERRVRVLARDILYFGSAIVVSSVSFEQYELKRSAC